ncbi:MAG: hypothetical protein QOF84_6963 [Streptomyces sp.]|jgi:hypothetical protein|nr:hypothetical protein [Streptomyces sp.]
MAPAPHTGEDRDGQRAGWRSAPCWSYGELFAHATRAANLCHSLGPAYSFPFTVRNT